MEDSLFIGIDIGTTGVRAAAFDGKARQRGYCYEEYSLLTDSNGKAELEPETIFGAFLKVTRGCVACVGAEKVAGIGISAQMHSLIAVDGRGKPLMNAMTWADARPAPQAARIARDFDAPALYRRTGCRVQHAAYYPAKLMWLKETCPETMKKAFKFVTIKEYILFRLFDGFVVDLTDASTTGCLDLRSFEWDDRIVGDMLELDKARFGDVVECTRALSGMKEEYASALGLSSSVPVVAGSSDGILAHIGCGSVDSETVSCSVGTSGAMRIAVDRPLLDKDGRTWCYCFTKDKWVAGGAVNNGGIVLKWFRDRRAGDLEKEIAAYGVKNAYKLFDRYVEEVAPGSDGLLFLPYIMGERSPGWHSDAEGFICGLRYAHDTRHIIRAAMEGILYNLYSIFEVLNGIEGGAGRIVANGGYVNSPTWLKMQADVFNRDIVVSTVGEAATWGAAYTAMVGVGAESGFDGIRQSFETNLTFHPDVNTHNIYMECYDRFRKLYDILVDRTGSVSSQKV